MLAWLKIPIQKQENFIKKVQEWKAMENTAFLLFPLLQVEDAISPVLADAGGPLKITARPVSVRSEKQKVWNAWWFSYEILTILINCNAKWA